MLALNRVRVIPVGLRLMANAKALPPVEELRDRFDYDPETGLITYRKSRYSNKIGQPAGNEYTNPNGKKYLRITLDSKGAVNRFFAHRIAWKLHYGVDPENQIDHIDGDGLNNRLSNLRDVTCSENLSNIKPIRSSVGVRGVTWVKANECFRAYISDAGQQQTLGHGDLLHCVALRKSAEKRLGYL